MQLFADVESNTYLGMTDNTILWVAAFGLIVLRIRQRSGMSDDDDASVYRTALFNPLAFCTASGFVVARSGLEHPVNVVILVFFFGGSIIASKMLK